MISKQKFGLDQSVIRSILEVLKTYDEIHEVVIYGSRAKGNYKAGSDIDLTLKAPKLGTSQLLKIENEIDDLMLPYKVDLSLYHQIENNDLIEHINRVGQRFQPPT